MLQGFQNLIPAGSTLPYAGSGFSQAAVIAQLESVLALYPAVASAKKATSSAVANLRAAVPGARSLLKSLKVALTAFYGSGSPELAEFGIASKTPQKPSSLQNAVKAAKAKQTREANGTLGKKQKAQAALVAQAQSVLVPQVTGAPTGSGGSTEPPAAPAKPSTQGQ
jgi:hypothetical protein